MSQGAQDQDPKSKHQRKTPRSWTPQADWTLVRSAASLLLYTYEAPNPTCNLKAPRESPQHANYTRATIWSRAWQRRLQAGFGAV